MKQTLMAAGILLASFVAADVRRAGDAWVMESEALEVTVDSQTALLSVRDKRTGTVWRQDDPNARASKEEKVRALRVSQPVTIDGSDKDWKRGNTIWLPWTGDNGEANCSAGARLMWDDERLYVYVRVRDDNVAHGEESAEQWWEADSVEFWLGSVQVGLHLAPKGREIACDPKGEPFSGVQIAVLPILEGRLPGYAVELSMPLEHFPILRSPQNGLRFRFAIGLNDADPKLGQPVRRVAQSYYPREWVHSAPQTFAVAVLCDEKGVAPPRTEANDRSGGVGGGVVTDMKPGAAQDTLTYDLVVTRNQSAALKLAVTLALSQGGAALDVTLTPRESAAPMRPFDYPAPLFPDRTPESYFLCVANYGNGSYVPVTDKMFRRRNLSLADLPFVAVTDGTQGLMVLALTPHDVRAINQTRAVDEAQCGFPGFRWTPVKGTFGMPRKGRLHFFSKGGHVTACKLYREVAKRDGYVRTLREKAKANPDVHKLMGAVNWWGAGGLRFAEEAKAAGMRHGLLNGRPSPEQIKAIVDLGWLIGEYDNYEDINDLPTIARAKAPVKEHGLVKPDGSLATAWISRDKDMKPTHTYMKQCTAMMTKSAKAVIPKVLETYPYNTRFLDVTTATGLKECYSPVHGLDRSEDMACRRRLCAYVADDLGLVAGGEHGRFWDVDILHYHEGMMGGGLYSWPAGYLRDVESRDELNDRYLNYSINPAHRAPLFELVFHDCVVNYWYWGACNDYLHDVAPEITDRKTAMNVLYGTPPMMWAYKHGLNWREPEDREKMLMIYRSVCKLHEVVGMQELMSHEFLTPDHMVQRTTFEDGTVCVANFAKAPYKLTDAQGTSFMLRENDFHVLGPKIEQWRVSRVDGEGKVSVKSFVNTGEVVFFDAADDFFTGAPGIGGKGKIWLALETPERAGITLYPGSSLSLDLASWQPAWKGESAVLLVLDSAGRPCARGSTVRDGKLELPVAERAANYVLLVGSEARKADVNLGEIVIEADGLKLETEQVPRPEAQLVAAATLTNNGLVSANDLTVSFRLGGASGRVLGEVSVPTLAPGATRRVEAPPFLAARADGRRRITVVVTSPEPCTQTGRVHLETRFRGPVQVSLFSFRRSLKLRIPQGDSTGVAAELPFSIDASVDPSNLRVLFADGRSAPAQFEPSAESATKGMLVFQLPAGLTAGAASCQVLGGGQGAAAPFPFAGEFEVAQDGSRLRFDSYSASLVNGVLKDIAVREADGGERIVIQQIIESSKETGWSAEPGTVEELVLESVGAVRAVFRMRKRLTADYVLERRFLFYADRFEIHSRCTPARTLLTRVLFAVPGTATKQTGGVVPMDGAGNMEGFGFQKNDAPDWYAVYAPDYRFVCVALSPHAGLTWWDEGTLGQAGIGHPAAVEWEKRLFFVTAEGAEDGTFAADLADATRTGVIAGQ